MEESNYYDSHLHEEENSNTNTNNNTSHGWQKVVYGKRQRKPTGKDQNLTDSGFDFRPNGTEKTNSVFRSVEQQADERRRKVLEAQKAAAAAAAAAAVQLNPRKPSINSDDDDSDGETAPVDSSNNGGVENKKAKQKKPKKPKVTVADAAAKIDASDLATYLVDITASYENSPEIELMRFADYFARAFSPVSHSQFPWAKIFKESSVAKTFDIPISYISEAVYKMSIDWLGQRSAEALGQFVLWSLGNIIGDLVAQHGAVKGSKKLASMPSSKAQVEMFVVLAMVLRRRPDVLTNLLPTLRVDPKFQGQDKLPFIIWVIAQACHGDLVVGMFAWTQNLLPLVAGKSGSNPYSRDLILQLVERIVTIPKARSILLNGAVRKGERLVPPHAFEMLMQVTFPVPSARIKATERFDALYPLLKELALAGSPGSKAMKQVAQQLLLVALDAINDNNLELSNEAVGIFLWCLTQNNECYKHWENIYLERVDASSAILRKLSDEWKQQSPKLAPFDTLRETLKRFRLKNEQVLASGVEDAARLAHIRAADKYCKVLLGRLKRLGCCMKSAMLAVTLGITVFAVMAAPNIESWDWKKLYVMFNSRSF